jgi:hypothetical protein
MRLQSQVFEFCTYDKPLRRYALDTSVIKCYGDVAMGRGTRVTTRHRTSEGNRNVLMYSYRKNGAVWPTVAKCCTSTNCTCWLNTFCHSRPHFKIVSPSCQHGNIAVTFYYGCIKSVAPQRLVLGTKFEHLWLETHDFQQLFSLYIFLYFAI